MESARTKVKRARKLNAELSTEVKNFWQSLKISCQIENGRATYKVNELSEVPQEIPLILGDITHNLISALDCLAFSEFKSNSISILKADKVYFKVFDSEEKYLANREYQQSISEKFDEITFDIKPYKGNQNQLWQLKKVDNISKHRNIVFTPPRLRGVNLARSMLNHLGVSEVLFPQFNLMLAPADGDFAKEEGLIFTDAQGSVCDSGQRFDFDLQILEEEIFSESVYLGDFVESSILVVDDILQKFESSLQPPHSPIE